MKLSAAPVTLLSYIRHLKKRRLIRLAAGLRGKKGIEIGGPSSFFGLKTYFPVYAFAGSIDGVNFSSETVWEGQLTEGNNYHYTTGKTGFQYIAEASDLSVVPDSEYDFLLSCHNLEHVANPIKALLDWKRVLKPGGMLVLSLPDKEFTFDNNRPVTSFEHMLEDYKRNVDEHDSTHFEEVIRLHNLERDKGVSNLEEHKKRTYDNFSNRCVHHHVFSLPLIRQLLEHTGFTVEHQQKVNNLHLVTVARKNNA